MENLYEKCIVNDCIPEEAYNKNNVFRGLRDINGNGVVTGLTNISMIKSFDYINGTKIPCDGKLWYRGYPIENLVSGNSNELQFEKIAYLLVTGEMPNPSELSQFKETLADFRKLPRNFIRDVIMKAPTADIMNSLTKSILTLSSYDKARKDLSNENSLVQCIRLIAEFPELAVYAYRAYAHYVKRKSMIIHIPDRNLSTAENILLMLRDDKHYTHMEAKVLDTALILHAEHGGGNNSTFTIRVVTSTGSDTYSAIAAALCSLKGPKHGGANIKAVDMMEDAAHSIKDHKDREEIRNYIYNILSRNAFDNSGLIYGMGHAVYSLSDPREIILKKQAEVLAKEKKKEKLFDFYRIFEEEAIKAICEKRKIYKGVCPNVDFYSGLVYSLLGIPKEMFTPIFAIARIAGWSAHRMEELIGANKVIRPAYKSIMQIKENII